MQNNKPFTPEEFKNIYSKVPRLCVEILIQTQEGIILTLRKLPTWNGLWHIPGGTVFYKESVKEAISRIAEEELGISVTPQKLLGYNEYLSEEKERGFGKSIGLIFLCDTSATVEQIIPNGDASEIKAFKKLPTNIIEEHRIFIESQGLITG